MATKQRFHGDSTRFEAVADYLAEHFPEARHIADVAGGQGMLTRLLNKRGFHSEVVDPRGWTLVGVAARQEEYKAHMADYYDVVVGLHPDEAIRDVVFSAVTTPVVVIPCCNFWDSTQKLGQAALADEIEKYFKENNISYYKVAFDFKGPKNVGFVTGEQAL